MASYNLEKTKEFVQKYKVGSGKHTKRFLIFQAKFEGLVGPDDDGYEFIEYATQVSRANFPKILSPKTTKRKYKQTYTQKPEVKTLGKRDNKLRTTYQYLDSKGITLEILEDWKDSVKNSQRKSFMKNAYYDKIIPETYTRQLKDGVLYFINVLKEEKPRIEAMLGETVTVENGKPTIIYEGQKLEYSNDQKLEYWYHQLTFHRTQVLKVEKIINELKSGS